MSLKHRPPLLPVHVNVNAQSPSSHATSNSSAQTVKLAPIFLKTPSTFQSSVTSPQSAVNHMISSSPTTSDLQTPTASRVHISIFPEDRDYASSSSHKRVRHEKHDQVQEGEDEMVDLDLENDLPGKRRARTPSISDFFSPTTPSRNDHCAHEKTRRRAPKKVVQHFAEQEEILGSTEDVWRRPRARLGLSGGSTLTHLTPIRSRPIAAGTPYLKTLFTHLGFERPEVPPSTILLTSLPRPQFEDRDFSPALALAFNNIAKTHTVREARDSGRRRLLAVAGEEGGVRIVDVDEGLGMHRDAKGFWWRAHSNAIFDIRWSGDDTRMLTAAGDQTSRLHALTAPKPILLATLRGHTSSVKTAVFFDPSRSYSPCPSSTSSVVASGARDGNILIYDLRCQGQAFQATLDRSSRVDGRNDRPTYEDVGFATQKNDCDLHPVMVIKQAHGDGKGPIWSRTATRSVTSLVAMETMPGILASGGSFDGVVKLWDLRFPSPTTRSPNPRPTCTPVASLADPTVPIDQPARRPRSINAICEQKTTGDLFALCGDSRIHTLRPSVALTRSEFNQDPTILPKSYTDPNLLVSSFYVRMSMSADGKYLGSGSSTGEMFTWEVDGKTNGKGEVAATRLALDLPGSPPRRKEREIGNVDMGKDLLAACSDDMMTRIWRPMPEVLRAKKESPSKVWEWVGPESDE